MRHIGLNLRRPKLHFFDLILVVLFLLSSYFLKGSLKPPMDFLRFHSEISLGYIAKQHEDRIYVIDSGHSRLICLDTDEKEVFELVDIIDDEGGVLYIDDIAITDHCIYISASEWAGMQVAREVILSMDRNGKNQKTCVENDYSSYFVNKHRFYGLTEIEGELLYAECLQNSILIHRVDPETLSDKVKPVAYSDAFNAVSDIVFDEDKKPIVMNKNGKIQYLGTVMEGGLIYSTEWPGEEMRVPYRLALYDGKIYFTDIRNREVVRANTEEQKGEICVEDTDTQTVVFSSDGKILLTEPGGVRSIGEQEKLYSSYRRLNSVILKQVLTLISMIIYLVVTLLVLIRVAVLLSKHSFTLVQKVILSIMISVFVVTGLISGMLLHSFRNSYRDKVKEQLEVAAYGVARQISVEDMQSIHRTTDFERESYQSICKLMENTLPSEQEFYRQIYCNILLMDEETGSAYAIAYLDKSIGVYFPVDEFETESVQMVYDTKKEVWDEEVLDISGSYLSLKVPILGKFDEVVGTVAVGLDLSVINETLVQMQKKAVMSVIVMVLIIWVLAEEIMSWLLEKEKRALEKRDEEKKKFPAHMIRILVFLVFGAYNLSSTFLPVYVLRNSDLFSGELRNLAASLPLTVNIFVLGVMSLFCAVLVRRIGMKRIMVFGALFALCGNLLLLLASNYYMVFIGLLLDGIGEGLIMNAMYVALTYIKNEEDRRTGFSIYNSANLSGINLGMLLGSLLAVYLGQRLVFLFSVITWVLLLVLGLRLVKSLEGLISEDEVSEEEQEKSSSGISSFRFITDKAVFTFMLFIQNPYIVFNSFVFYLVPIFCSDNGYDETIVSVLIMLYSQIAVLSGDKLTDRFSAIFRNRAMYVAIALNISAVLIFALTGSVEGLVAALVLLGVSAAFGKPVQQNYLLNRKAAVQYGEDRAIGVYNFTENIGESLGPVVFSRLMSTARSGYFMFLAVVAGCCGLHFVTNTKEIDE